MALKKDNCRPHLSEPFSDSSLGVAARIEIEDVHAYTRALNAKEYEYCGPGSEEREPTPWSTIEATIADPFGNQLVFVQDGQTKRPLTPEGGT